MRRNDREIVNENEIIKFISSEKILRIAFYDGGDIYIVPVNYGYIYDGQVIFYFHGAKAGHKYELAKNAPRVGFEIDGSYGILESKDACDYSATFQSVVGVGKLVLVEEHAEKILGLNAIMKQVTKQGEWQYKTEMLDAVAVFRLDVDKLSCKANILNNT